MTRPKTVEHIGRAVTPFDEKMLLLTITVDNYFTSGSPGADLAVILAAEAVCKQWAPFRASMAAEGLVAKGAPRA